LVLPTDGKAELRIKNAGLSLPCPTALAQRPRPYINCGHLEAAGSEGIHPWFGLAIRGQSASHSNFEFFILQ